jgi:hypothetical protein
MRCTCTVNPENDVREVMCMRQSAPTNVAYAWRCSAKFKRCETIRPTFDESKEVRRRDSRPRRPLDPAAEPTRVEALAYLRGVPIGNVPRRKVGALAPLEGRGITK